MRDKEDLGFYCVLIGMGVAMVIMIAMITEAKADSYWFEGSKMQDTVPSGVNPVRGPQRTMTDVEVDLNQFAYSRIWNYKLSDTVLVKFLLDGDSLVKITSKYDTISFAEVQNRATDLGLPYPNTDD